MEIREIHCFMDHNKIKYEIISESNEKIIADIDDIKDLEIL